MKFDIVVADPPYSFTDQLKMANVKRGASSNYSTMSANELIELPVKDVVSENALLALWCPSALLALGLQLMNSYGFDLKQTWIWVKTKKEIEPTTDLSASLSFGLGRIGRNVHELVLVGTRGSVYDKIQNKSQRTVFFAPNEKHSKKPEKLQDMLDTIFPNQELKRLELFARRQRNRWHCIGNECPGDSFEEDIRTSIKRLKESQ